VKTVQHAISRRGWEAGPDPSEVLNMAQFKPKVNAGIGTLIQMQQNQERATGALLSDGLSDLEALMLQAKDMVAVAEKLKAAVEKEQKAAAVADSDDYSSLLMQAGIVSPVSQEVAGKSFHSELAGQLADFLTPIIGMNSQSAGRADRGVGPGMMTLTDAYCLYNRARGIDLISPADMRQACELFAGKGLPFRVRSDPVSISVCVPSFPPPSCKRPVSTRSVVLDKKKQLLRSV
jgi:ESCRT-II complex subunit VPS36